MHSVLLSLNWPAHTIHFLENAPVCSPTCFCCKPYIFYIREICFEIKLHIPCTLCGLQVTQVVLCGCCAVPDVSDLAQCPQLCSLTFTQCGLASPWSLPSSLSLTELNLQVFHVFMCALMHG